MVISYFVVGWFCGGWERKLGAPTNLFGVLPSSYLDLNVCYWFISFIVLQDEQ
jgi:hypothetical protein